MALMNFKLSCKILSSMGLMSMEISVEGAVFVDCPLYVLNSESSGGVEANTSNPCPVVTRKLIG
jgi:hypothetical protein